MINDMKPLGRNGKYYSINCPRKRGMCVNCAAEHAYYTRGKSRTQAKQLNRTIQKRLDAKLIEEYEEEMNEGI